MPWNGSGTFNRIYSWVADKAAGLDISSSRMDTDSNDIASNGFGNCLTRDGQGQATANLPMATFRHTGVGNGVARTDYAAMGQVQDGLLNWSVAAGTSDAISVTLTPALTLLADGQLVFFRATAANTTTAPTLQLNGAAIHTITKSGGGALVAGNIPGNLAEIIVRYNLSNARWELLNPTDVDTGPPTRQIFTTGSSATYTTPAGCVRLQIRMVAGGAGGGSNGTASSNQGTDGGDTSFNAIVASHGHGGGATNSTAATPGGNGGNSGAGSASIRINGGNGDGGIITTNYTSNAALNGTRGGNTMLGFGGEQLGSVLGANGRLYGGGGGGAGTSAPQTFACGGGGGGGEYVEFFITSPAATYTYTVGTGGAGGVAGSGGNAGGNGAAGIIIVDEFYGF